MYVTKKTFLDTVYDLRIRLTNLATKIETVRKELTKRLLHLETKIDQSTSNLKKTIEKERLVNIYTRMEHCSYRHSDFY